MGTLWKVLTRKKIIDPVSLEATGLSRVLNTFDLTALGVGSTLGVGVYVIAGHVAKDTAGPAVVLSFLIAAIASVFAGLCYAEFGARAPKAGSAYIYSYVCVGEFVAFVIGWNLILEYVIGSASVARGLSLYLDTLLNHTMKNTFIDIAPIHVDFMSNYFDFFSFGISVLLSIALAFGMKESKWANNIFTILNVLVVLFVVFAGSFKTDVANWHVEKNTTSTAKIGEGGFFPFGVEGMIKGAATCFYGFVGFDCIATTGEEVKNPKKAIPISIIVSLLIIFLAYFGTSVVVTLMIPYYEQDPDAPIPHAFEAIGWNWAKWIVAIGGIFGLCASLFGAMFPLPRIIYAMASDGLVFRFLGKISEKFKTPVVGTLLAGILTGLMSAMFELHQLVNMMSIGTLLAYTIVAASVLLLRFAKDEETQYIPVKTSSDSDDNNSEGYTDNRMNVNGEDDHFINRTDFHSERITFWNGIKQIFNCHRHKTPSNLTERIVSIEVFLYCIVCILVGLSAIYLKNPLSNGEVWAIILTSLAVFLAVFLVMSLATQPLSQRELSFKVPLVPIIPALSILVNICLMLMLDSHTWIRFGVWMAIGIPTYYFSVRRHPDARNESLGSINVKPPPFQKSNGKSNGFYSNKSFTDDNGDVLYLDDGELTSTVKRKPVNNFGKDYIQRESFNAIAQLDEILENEDNKISSNNNNNSVSSKKSIVTVSSVSNVPFEESVVADVHSSNFVTSKQVEPVQMSGSSPSLEENASSKTEFDPISPVQKELEENALHKLEPELILPFPDERESVPLSPVNKTSSKKKLAPPPPPPLVLEDYKVEVLDKSPIKNAPEITTKGEFLEPDNKTESEKLAPPPPPPLPIVIEDFKIEDSNKAFDKNTAKNTPEIYTEAEFFESGDKPESENSSNIPKPPKPPLSRLISDDDTLVLAPRPTAANLNSVTLKPVKPRAEEGAKLEPPSDHLKFGSKQYDMFREKLDTNLKKVYAPLLSNVPSVRHSTPSPEKVEFVPNENVNTDPIDRRDAKEKLFVFYDTHPFLPIDVQKDSDENESVKKEPDGASTVVKDQVQIIEEDNRSNNSSNTSNSENDKGVHLNKMQNVFSSIKLRKVQSFSEPR